MCRILRFLIVLSLSAALSAAAEPLSFPNIRQVNERLTLMPVGETNFSFKAQLLTKCGKNLFLGDETGCIRVEVIGDADAGLENGDIIDLKVLWKPTGIPLLLRSFRVLEHRSPPEPVEIPGGLVSSGEYLNRYVRVKGVVFASVSDELDSRYNWTLMKTSSGLVTFATNKNRYSLDELRKLIDSEATIQGVVLRFSTWRTMLGGRIEPTSPEPIQITRPAPTDLDAIPRFSGTASLHRQRMSGTVIATCHDRFFIRSAKGRCVQIRPTDETSLPLPGARVTVAGFAELDPLLNIRLVESLVRTEDGRPDALDEPTDTDFATLFRNNSDHEEVNKAYNQRVIRLSGEARIDAGEEWEAGRITLTDGRHLVMLDASAFPSALKDVTPGCIVEVSGFCIGEFDQPTSAIVFPKFRGFTVIPRSPDEIRIVRRPPWWSPAKFLVLIVLLAAVLVAILVWNRALRTLSERRGRELAREQLDHASSELKVEERTRLAVELHDSISQTLTGVALQIDAAQGSSGHPDASVRFLETAQAMLASCRQELRCCIWDLKSRTFDEHDMTEAVTRTLAPHLGDVETQVRFNVPRQILSESATHDILRIVRELAVNAIRHGRAKHLRVAGEYRDGQVRFSVRDDGSGFDPAAAVGPAQGHFGLQGIGERIRRRNGSISIESAPGRGTKITVAFAADERDEDEQK